MLRDKCLPVRLDGNGFVAAPIASSSDRQFGAMTNRSHVGEYFAGGHQSRLCVLGLVFCRSEIRSSGTFELVRELPLLLRLRQLAA
jgi:hypothetical protein